MNIVINGRFIGQRTTGVQRFAREVVLALDDLLGSAEYRHLDGCFRLAVPSASFLEAPRLEHIGTLVVGGKASHAWEQLSLPAATRGSMLLNLAGSAPLLKRNQICTFHDAAVFDRPEAYRPAFVAWYRMLFRVQSRASRLLLTVSEYSRERLAATLGLEQDRMHIVHNGMDHMLRSQLDADVLSRLGLAPQRYLLAVGSANPTKNFAALVRAFLSLPASSDLRLVIVGGANSTVFAGADSTMASDRRLVFTGSIDDARLKALYTHATAFVFPSTYEGFGIPPLEAMACGCPVVASTAAAVMETCGDAALYFDPHDEHAIADALARVLRDAGLRTALTRRGAERAARFTWARAAKQLLAHLDDAGILNRSRA